MVKKIACLLAVLAAACFTFAGCSGGDEEEKRITVNPISQNTDVGERTMGDVMPFFDGEKMNVYHLQNNTGSNPMYYHPIARVSTTDFLSYEENGIVLDFEETVDSPDAALGTGSFIRDKDGIVHAFYTGHNPLLYPVECIRHAVSYDNQETWVKDEYFTMVNGQNDFRDPYLYYDEATEKYCMLIMTRDWRGGLIDRYTADTLSAAASEWKKDSQPFYRNPAGDYNMECPSYFNYNGYYYLMFSEQGAARVTHYRYKQNEEDEWIIPAHDAIDGEGFYAGRPEIMDGTLYAFAWCAKTKTGEDYGEFDWGGNLVVHKLEQQEDGRLIPVMLPQIKEKICNDAGLKFIDGSELSDITFKGDKFEAKCVEALKDKVMRMSFTFTPQNGEGDFGITFGLDKPYNNRLNNAVLAFDLKNNKFSYYNNVFSVLRYHDTLVQNKFEYETGKKYAVDVVIDKQIVSVYLDGTLAMTMRIYSMPQRYFAFYSNGSAVKIEAIKIYE